MSYCYCSLTRLYVLNRPVNQAERHVELPDEGDCVLRLPNGEIRDDLRQGNQHKPDNGLPTVRREERKDLIKDEKHVDLQVGAYN